jgi:hypothetical protein
MIQDIDIRLLCRNTGQIEGLPKNPRFIRDEKFELLKKSIQENPEMLSLRELLVYPLDGKYIVIGGNMRLEACKALGYKTVPCKVLDAATTVEQLKAYTVKDNAGFGEWDWDMLANEWDSAQLTEWGVDVPEWDVQQDEQEQVVAEPKEKPTTSEVTIASVTLFGQTDETIITVELTPEQAETLLAVVKKDGASVLIQKLLQ